MSTDIHAWRRTYRIAACLAAVSVCYTAAVFSQQGLNRARRDADMDEILYLPNEKLLTHFTAGLNTIIADMLWLHCIQYTAIEHRGKRHFTWLEHMLFTVTRLDPHFTAAYRYGAIFLAALRADAEASLRLAHKGMILNPHAWQLPYEAAMNYLLNKRTEPNARRYAAHYLGLAVATGTAPGGVVNLAAKLQGEYDLRDIEQDMWQNMRNSEDPFLRELAERKLAEMFLGEAVTLMNERLQEYARRHGKPASAFQQLVDEGLIRAVPDDPLGGTFFLGPDGKAYSTTLLDEKTLRSRDRIMSAIDLYMTHTDSFPASLEALLEARLLEEIPPHPYPGRAWKYDPATGTLE